jgi:hypothetical protein
MRDTLIFRSSIKKTAIKENELPLPTLMQCVQLLVGITNGLANNVIRLYCIHPLLKIVTLNVSLGRGAGLKNGADSSS